MSRARPTSALIPAAARAATALSTVEEDLSASAIDTFTKAVGGRDALVEVLAVAETAPDVEQIVSLLLDPRYSTWSLRRLCTLAGLTVADLFTAYKKAAIVRAHIQAAPIIADRLVGVVRDVMDRAQPYEIACTMCGGLGTTTTPGKPDAPPVPCVPCRGGGKLIALPELDRQKLALELGQLVQKAGGLTVNQQTNLIANRASSTAPGALEQMQQAMGEILFSAAGGNRPPASSIESLPATPPADSPVALDADVVPEP